MSIAPNTANSHFDYRREFSTADLRPEVFTMRVGR